MARATSSRSLPTPKLTEPLDRWAIGLMLALGLAIALVWWHGDRSLAKVREFNWQDRQVSAGDRAMLFTFNRPMDHTSVEQNFQVQPPLPGRFSWAGRRMAYTLNFPIPYTADTYQVKIQGARDRLHQTSSQPMAAFQGSFQTRNRAFAYIGVTGQEANRLVLYNLTQKQQKILTPPDLLVSTFELSPEGDRAVFLASDRQSAERGEPEQQLYSVATGLDYRSVTETAPPKTSTPTSSPQRLVDSKDYNNLRFDLSPDGKTILIQRANKRNPGGDFGLWILRDGQPVRPFKAEPGGEFRIAPDGVSLVMLQGQGTAVLPLESGAKPLDFLPKFGMFLDFTADGTQAAMVKYNGDYTSSLFLVTNQGIQKELLRLNGQITQARFEPLQQLLYVLISERLTDTSTYQEQPSIISLDVKAALAAKLGERIIAQRLYDLPLNQRDLHLSMAPDGLALLFDLIETSQSGNGPESSNGQAIATSRLWVLPLVPPALQNQPQEATERPAAEPLPLQGVQPKWLP